MLTVCRKKDNGNSISHFVDPFRPTHTLCGRRIRTEAYGWKKEGTVVNCRHCLRRVGIETENNKKRRKISRDAPRGGKTSGSQSS